MTAIGPDVLERDVIVSIRYRASAIIRKMAVFQLVPVVIAIKLAFGRVEKPLLLDVALAGGAVLYGMVMVTLVNALRQPEVLSVDRDGGLRWRPMFTDRAYQLPTGSSVTVTEKTMIVTPAVAGISGTMRRDGKTVFQLPGGIYPPVTGVWRI